MLNTNMSIARDMTNNTAIAHDGGARVAAKMQAKDVHR